MKLCIVTCLWKRPELTKVVLDYYKNTFPDITLIAVKTLGDFQYDNDGWSFIYHDNNPLSQKFNKAFESAKAYSPDAVILIGSDDLISTELIEYYTANYSKDSDYMLGLKDLYIHDVNFAQTYHWHGLPDEDIKIPIGCGRIFSKKILDKLNWRPYNDLVLNRGLDTHSACYIINKRIEIRRITMNEANCVVVDLKVKEAINPTSEWKYNATPSTYDILFKKFKKEMETLHSLNSL